MASLLFGQSGGPTSVINASAAGVFETALAADGIDQVLGAAHGIVGILGEHLYDIGAEDPAELALLRSTPSSALGTCRYKLAHAADDERDYARLLEVFQAHDVRYFCYNGGNDSMDTANKISKYLARVGYECHVAGVPKTIDNDLADTDHTPGFASTARYLASTAMETWHDVTSYDTPMIAIVETMGRNAGWLAAATAAAADKGAGPDLIYLPEVAFDLEKFTDDVLSLAGRQQHVIAAVSEGVRTADGRYVPELAADVKTDAFGHKQMGGTAVTLANHLRNRTEIKVRGIEINLPQRAAAHWAAARDVAEAYEAGATAVREVLGGRTDVMVGFDRRSDDPYECVMTTVPLDNVANTERVVPPEWITPEQTFVTGDYLHYLYPLIAEGAQVPLEDGLPRFARLRRQHVEQRLG